MLRQFDSHQGMTHTPPTSILTVQVWSGSRIEAHKNPFSWWWWWWWILIFTQEVPLQHRMLIFQGVLHTLLHELHSNSTTIMLVKCSFQNLWVHIECTCASNWGRKYHIFTLSTSVYTRCILANSGKNISFLTLSQLVAKSIGGARVVQEQEMVNEYYLNVVQENSP